MVDLHDLLEDESQRFSLPAGAAERMWERGKRRERSRRITTMGLGAVLFVAILVILRSSWPGAQREQTPADDLTPTALAGTYAVELGPQDPGVQVAHMAGRYEMRLSTDGHLELVSPKGFDLTGGAFRFEISGQEMTTDALVGAGCRAPGTYRVVRDAGVLSLVPIQERCELRRLVLGTRPWAAVRNGPASDTLEGDWMTTFSCDQMVRAVRRAPVTAQVEAFWTAATADRFGSDDLGDPCRAAPESLAWMLRFSDGRLQIFDPPDLSEGFDGSYVIRGNVLTISDGSERNIDGRYEVAFRIEGGQVSFDLIGRGASDAFFVATWETAPFVRTS